MADPNLASEYVALTEQAGFVHLAERTVVQLSGDDRLAFLHNFCTNEIKKLEPGNCCEAFVLNTKGKILSHVHVVADNEKLLLLGHGMQGATLVEHLDKYLIREDVELLDRSSEFASVFVCGKLTAERVGSICERLPSENETLVGSVAGVEVQINNVEVAGFGYLLQCLKDSIGDVVSALESAQILNCSAAALEVVRLESQTPWFGIDVDDSNLPQELQRDDKAISFDKGCYLGQETVARIDARGRVNQLLVEFNFADPSAAKLGEFMAEEKSAGRVTSLVEHPVEGKQIGMGYVRRQYSESGTVVGGVIVK